MPVHRRNLPRGGGPTTPRSQKSPPPLHSERFVDKAPAAIVATLLEEDTYKCSERTMYRILAAESELKPHRRAARRPTCARPELMATRPRQVWSWDVTWLRGPVPEKFYYLYVTMDIFSRYAVGWTLAEKESTEHATTLIDATYAKEGIDPGELTLHAELGRYVEPGDRLRPRPIKGGICSSFPLIERETAAIPE